MAWGCFILVAAALVVSLAAPWVTSYLLFVVPCGLMMFAMIWMMVRDRGSGGGSRDSR